MYAACGVASCTLLLLCQLKFLLHNTLRSAGLALSVLGALLVLQLRSRGLTFAIAGPIPLSPREKVVPPYILRTSSTL